LAGSFRSGAYAKQKFSALGGAISVTALLAIFLVIPNSPMFYSSTSSDGRSDVWYFAELAAAQKNEDRSSATESRPPVDWEGSLADQPRMIETVVNGLNAADGNPHVFFIGMAPFSGQTVFSREVITSRGIFDKHFKTDKRSVILLNSWEPSKVIPMASASNLKTLAAVLKSKIDPQKDVFVLFITSHGNKDLIAVDQYPIPFNQITPIDIKQTLDATGARNRLVIISACYSGSFIDDLKDDNTAIITAASEDRTSFGCSNERDWTFFTNALFNHGFRKSRDINQAFKQASQLVDSWEKKQQLIASRPQIFVGKEFEAAWAKLLPSFDQSISEPIITLETANDISRPASN
jgi:hypothetical protein